MGPKKPVHTKHWRSGRADAPRSQGWIRKMSEEPSTISSIASTSIMMTCWTTNRSCRWSNTAIIRRMASMGSQMRSFWGNQLSHWWGRWTRRKGGWVVSPFTTSTKTNDFFLTYASNTFPVFSISVSLKIIQRCLIVDKKSNKNIVKTLIRKFLKDINYWLLFISLFLPW